MATSVRLKALRAARLASALLLGLSPSLLQAAECGMTQIMRHGDPNRTRIYAASEGVASLYFKTDMDVNTDGAARSYHPDDPRGETLAFNNMGNAITRMFDASGSNITCSPRRGACFTRFIRTFEAARDARYNPNGFPRVATNGIIPWRMDSSLGWQVPCTIQSGPFRGYFVSQTSLIVDPSKSECDQGRYLDSFTYAAVVLPGAIDWRSQGVRTDEGDLVAVRDARSGRIAFAINGDRGGANAIGEGSIALVAALNGRALDGDEPYSEIRALALASVQYVIFPRDDIRRIAGTTFTQSDIDRVGEELFERWGGTERLDACAALPG